MQERRRSARRRHPTRAGFDSPLPSMERRPKLSEDDRLVLAGKKFSIDDPGRTGRCWRGVDPWLPWKKPTPADRCPFQSCFAARVRALRRSRARAFFASNTFLNEHHQGTRV